MNLQGFIKKIGEPRTWNTKENETRYSYPITISLPYVGADGKEREDELIAEHTAGNPEYIDKLKESMEKRQRMEFRLSFNIRQWEGKEFNNIKLYNVQILL